MIVHNISELSLKLKVYFRRGGYHPTLRPVTPRLVLRGTYRHTPLVVVYQDNLAMILGQIDIIEHIRDEMVQINRLPRSLQIGQHNRRSQHPYLLQPEDPPKEFF